jgi:putative membrane protein
MWNGWMGGWGWGFGMIAMALFWVVLLVAAVFIVRAVVERPTRGAAGGSGETPLEILQRRYARGEIDRQQYEQMKRDLS